MFVDIATWKAAVRDSVPHGMERRVADALAGKFNSEGVTQISADAIGDAALLYARASEINRAADKLRRRGLLSITRLPDSERYGLQYQALMPTADQARDSFVAAPAVAAPAFRHVQAVVCCSP